MSIDLIGLDTKVQGQLTKLDRNLNVFKEMQKETEKTRDHYEAAKVELGQLEQNSRNKMKALEQQAERMLLEMNDKLEKMNHLQDLFNAVRKEFIEMADRMEAQKLTILGELNETRKTLTTEQENIRRGMMTELDHTKAGLLDAIAGTSRKMESEMRNTDVKLQVINNEAERMYREIAALNKSSTTTEVVINNLQNKVKTDFVVCLIVAGVSILIAIGAFIFK